LLRFKARTLSWYDYRSHHARGQFRMGGKGHDL
jgi:hypothetical protein